MPDGPPRDIGDHESALRSLVAAAHGVPHVSYRTLVEAQCSEGAIVVLEGDYGGQIYATAPVRSVLCDEATLVRVVEALEALCWGQQGGRVLFEQARPNKRVVGGMGGAAVIDGIWAHEELRQPGLVESLAEVFAGQRSDVPEPDPVVTPEARAAIVKAYDDRIDVFCWVFGFESPSYLDTMPRDERERRSAAAIPVPAGYKRWYPSTLRVVVRGSGRTVPR